MGKWTHTKEKRKFPKFPLPRPKVSGFWGALGKRPREPCLVCRFAPRKGGKVTQAFLGPIKISQRAPKFSFPRIGPHDPFAPGWALPGLKFGAPKLFSQGQIVSVLALFAWANFWGNGKTPHLVWPPGPPLGGKPGNVCPNIWEIAQPNGNERVKAKKPQWGPTQQAGQITPVGLPGPLGPRTQGPKNPVPGKPRPKVPKVGQVGLVQPSGDNWMKGKSCNFGVWNFNPQGCTQAPVDLRKG